MPTDDHGVKADLKRLFLEIARERNLPVSDSELLDAVETRRQSEEKLDAMRRFRLGYLPPFIEPATSLAWLDQNREREGKRDGTR
jgi:hypothetical protein